MLSHIKGSDHYPYTQGVRPHRYPLITRSPWGPGWGLDMKHFRTRRGHLSFAILELASEREKDSPRAGLFLWIYKGISPVLRGLCPLGDVAFALPFRGAKGDLP